MNSKHSAPGLRSDAVDLGEHVIEELLVVQRGAGDVDAERERGAVGRLVTAVRKPAAGLSHDPAVDGRHQVEALGCRYELGGLHQRAVLVAHAQQQLELALRVDAASDRHDRLAQQHQLVLVAGAIDARDPLHLAVPLRRAALLVGLHAVASGVLRRVAGDVRGAHHGGGGFGFPGDLGQADRDADLQHALLPEESIVPDRLAQSLGDAVGGVERAVVQQHAELVAAEPRQGVAGTDTRLHDAGDLLEQPVAGLVAAGVVDDLELVEVEVQQHVAHAGRSRVPTAARRRDAPRIRGG